MKMADLLHLKEFCFHLLSNNLYVTAGLSDKLLQH